MMIKERPEANKTRSDGFPRAGVERINDSIRTYCWTITDSHSQTRTDILGTGTLLDAQKQFIANIRKVQFIDKLIYQVK